MSKQSQHWEKTRGLLFVTLAIWFVFSIGIFFSEPKWKHLVLDLSDTRCHII